MSRLHPGWAWYVSYLARRRWTLVLVALGGAVLTVTGLPVLALVRYAFDTAIPARNVQGLLVAGVAILGFRLITAAANLLVVRRSARALRAITADIRTDLMARFYRLRWIDRASMDESVAHGRLVLETEKVEQLTLGLFLITAPALGPLIAYGAVMAWLSWQMTLLVAVLVPLTRLLTLFTMRRFKQTVTVHQEALEQFHLSTGRLIQMLSVTRMQAGEDEAIAGYRGVNTRLANAGSDMVVAGATNTQVNAAVSALVAVAALVVGGIAVSNGSLTLGAMAAFFVAASQTNGAVNGLTRGVPLILAGHVALARLAELREMGEEEPAGGDAAPDMTRSIDLRGVTLAYPGRRVLKGVDLSIEPGAITALCAPNGEGKTTLLEMVLGLHRPQEGQVSLGETDFDDLDLFRYRRMIGVSPQNPRLVRGSIRENILFGRSHFDEAALNRAIRQSALDPVLEARSQGLDSPVGDAGQSLSGGERQRVALARALVHGPRLLILDEPSNHLDAETLALVIERLFRAPDRPTILMATHDQRLLAIADHIYELSRGLAHRRADGARAAVGA